MKCITYNQAEQIFDAAKNYNKDTYASIENFKSVGDNSTPVYFDENGIPKAIKSFPDSVLFELDENGDFMPSV